MPPTCFICLWCMHPMGIQPRGGHITGIYAIHMPSPATKAAAAVPPCLPSLILTPMGLLLLLLRWLLLEQLLLSVLLLLLLWQASHPLLTGMIARYDGMMVALQEADDMKKIGSLLRMDIVRKVMAEPLK